MDPVLIKQGLVPIVAILTGMVGILAPVAIVGLWLHFRQRKTMALMETVKHLAERGLPVPPELLDPPKRKREGQSPLFSAVTLIGVGVGLALMFWLLNLAFLVGIGALAVCIGVAQLIALRIERRMAPPEPRA